MSDYKNDELERMISLHEVIADAFAEATDQEIDQAIVDQGLDARTLTSDFARTIDGALNQSLKRKLVEAGQAARSKLSEVRPDLSGHTREQLIEKFKLITANDENAGEMLTMAARSGRGSMSVEELRALIEDFYSIQTNDDD